MKTAKHYAFKPWLIVFEPVFTTGLIGFFIWFLVKLLPLLSGVAPLFFLLFFAALGVVLYVEIKTCLVLRQYYLEDKGKNIIISADRLTLNLSQGNKNLTIHSNEVVKVEIYDGKPWSKFQDFNYLIIYTKNNQRVIITQFTIWSHDAILGRFLRQKPRVYFKKRFNYIN
jgi:hypothetical protein